ncbi:hypothetical protein [Nonomuraea sp. NPDC049750]|uniref:hypothetical protein n=1 Tax=Nonomuraea sp. NPDC049750 TaxID=3154738 RepID=UPI0033D9B0DB
MNLYELFEHGDVAALTTHLEQQPDSAGDVLQMAAQSERLDLLECVLSHRPPVGSRCRA